MDQKLSNRRISKFKRRELPGDPNTHLQDIFQKPFLTKRDKAVLLSIYYHRCLTTEQLTQMHFKYSDNGLENSQAAVIARRRLRKLFDHCLVDRFFVDVGENNGSSQAHFILDSLGARVVAGLLNLKVEELAWRYEMNEARLPYLGHMVKINDFYLMLLEEAHNRGHDVSDFRTENHVRHEFNHWGRHHVFNPDAYGQYWMGDEGFHFFLELDNGTMTPQVFQKKHKRYVSFYASGAYEAFYSTFPLILTVTTDWERAKQLRDCIYKVDNTDMMWLFTSEDAARNDVLGRIWLGEGKELTALF